MAEGGQFEGGDYVDRGGHLDAPPVAPARMRRRDRRKARKAEAKVAQRIERHGAPPALPAYGDGVHRDRVAAREDLPGDGASVVQLSRTTTVRARVPFPLRGVHSFTPTDSERRAIRRALRVTPSTPGHLVREAVLRAAGVGAEVTAVREYNVETTARVPSRGGVSFRLTREERDAVDAAMRARDFGEWVRDAVRTAVGMEQHPWSPSADAVLTKGFRRWGIDELLRALPGRDPGKVYDRAARLGLSRELTDERVKIAEAEAIAGYDNRGLTRLLAEEGVKVYVLAGRYAGGKNAHRFVLRAELMRAVQAHLAKVTETVHEAAKRLGVYREALRREVERIGHRKPEGFRIWRLPPAVFDEAHRAMGAPRLTLGEAAVRAGVPRWTVRRWLVDAGAIDAADRRHAIDPAALERVLAARRSAAPAQGDARGSAA